MAAALAALATAALAIAALATTLIAISLTATLAASTPGHNQKLPFGFSEARMYREPTPV